MKVGVATLVAFCLSIGSAAGAVSETPLLSATAGIAFGPDGSAWVAEQSSGQVARVSPTGQVLSQYSVGSSPEGVAAGPGGRIWVTVTGADKLVWFDAGDPIPTPHEISTTGASNCGPVAVVSGGDSRIYFSAPSSDGMCNGGVSTLSRVNADGTGAIETVAAGEAFDLAASGGKLFVPDASGNQVRRLALPSRSLETTISTPSGSEPHFIAISPAAEAWISLSTSNQVAHFPLTQNGGNAAVLPLANGLLSHPNGIAFGPNGTTYIASGGNSSLVEIDGSGVARSIALAGSEPFALATAPDGSLWITDQARARVLRYVAPTPPATPSPPAPGPPADKSPPAGRIGGKKSQKIGSFVTIVASCPSEACRATATGHLILDPRGTGSKPKSLPLRRAATKVPAGGHRTLKLRLPMKARKAAKSIAAKGGKVTAKVSLRVADAAGNVSRPKRFSVTLTAGS